MVRPNFLSAVLFYVKKTGGPMFNKCSTSVKTLSSPGKHKTIRFIFITHKEIRRRLNTADALMWGSVHVMSRNGCCFVREYS